MAADKGKWVCNCCGHTETREKEIKCWKCGKGEMICDIKR